MGISTLLFDCGGVVLRDHAHSAYPAWEARLGLAPGELRHRLWHGPAWEQAERGQIDEAEFWLQAGAALGLSPEQARSLGQDLWSSWEVDPQVLALVERARARYRVAMLSNATNVLEEYLRDRFDVADRFQPIINSARLGIAKPDRAIFEHALHLLQAQPEEVVFIDDRAENVTAAAALGMHVIWFVSPAELERQLAVFLNHHAESGSEPVPEARAEDRA